jgi:hypothetical protein
VQQARQSKTDFFYNNQQAFLLSLAADIWSLANRATKLGLIPLVRPNGTSDIPYENLIVWDNKTIFQLFPEIQFYDYTKIANRKDLPNNYDLTFSYSNVVKFQKYNDIAIGQSMRLAAVFRFEKDIPSTFRGMPVIGGDNSDVRHVEPLGHIVALYAKGKAIKDQSGFVI